MRRPPTRWGGPELNALRAAYEAGDVYLADLAVQFRTCEAKICLLARQHNWKMRGRTSRALPDYAHAHRKLYKKLQALVGRDAALKAIADAHHATAQASQ